MQAAHAITEKTPEDLLAHLRVSRTQSFSAGEQIYLPGSRAECLFVILQGFVKISRWHANREVVIGLYGPETIFGESAMIEAHRTHEATAVTDAKVMVWTARDLELAGNENPRLLYALLQVVIERCEKLHGRVESLTSESARERLARALVEFSQTTAGKTREGSAPRITQKFLAGYIGTSRELVSQLMNDIRRNVT
jgi:CRP-like cAMP-binding protein